MQNAEMPGGIYRIDIAGAVFPALVAFAVVERSVLHQASVRVPAVALVEVLKNLDALGADGHGRTIAGEAVGVGERAAIVAGAVEAGAVLHEWVGRAVGVGVVEAGQDAASARQGQLERRAVAVVAAIGGDAIEVMVRALDQAVLRVVAVVVAGIGAGRAIESPQGRNGAGGGDQLENRAQVVRAAIVAGAVDVAVGGGDEIGVGTVAGRIAAVEAMHEGVAGAVLLNLVEAAVVAGSAVGGAVKEPIRAFRQRPDRSVGGIAGVEEGVEQGIGAGRRVVGEDGALVAGAAIVGRAVEVAVAGYQQ